MVGEGGFGNSLCRLVFWDFESKYKMRASGPFRWLSMPKSVKYHGLIESR